MGVLFWIVFTIVLLLIEAATFGLVTIWFACGAFVSTILSLFVKSILIEWIVFIIVSLVTLLAMRPIVAKKYNASTKPTNIDSLIGMQAKVTETINNADEKGTVYYNGLTWTAVSYDDKIIEKDSLVTILEIKGVKLIVKEKEEE